MYLFAAHEGQSPSPVAMITSAPLETVGSTDVNGESNVQFATVISQSPVVIAVDQTLQQPTLPALETSNTAADSKAERKRQQQAS